MLATAFFAYLIKGVSGFGPALFLIPLLSLFFPASQAILLSTFLDMCLGFILFLMVRKRIDWKMIIPLTVLFFIGTTIGARLLPLLAVDVLKKIIGVIVIVFLVLLQMEGKSSVARENKQAGLAGLTIALLAGFTGGLTGISGPLIVLYMKFRHTKVYFRDQLIFLFFAGAVWRFLVYSYSGLRLEFFPPIIALTLGAAIIGMLIGNRLHWRIGEAQFNILISFLLLLPAVNLIFFS